METIPALYETHPSPPHPSRLTSQYLESDTLPNQIYFQTDGPKEPFLILFLLLPDMRNAARETIPGLYIVTLDHILSWNNLRYLMWIQSG